MTATLNPSAPVRRAESFGVAAMLTKSQAIILGVACFVSGFVVCWLTRQPHLQGTPVGTAIAPFPPVALLSVPTVSTQTFYIHEGDLYQWPDGTMHRNPTPEVCPGYYDLIDTRAGIFDLK